MKLLSSKDSRNATGKYIVYSVYGNKKVQNARNVGNEVGQVLYKNEKELKPLTSIEVSGFYKSSERLCFTASEEDTCFLEYGRKKKIKGRILHFVEMVLGLGVG